MPPWADLAAGPTRHPHVSPPPLPPPSTASRSLGKLCRVADEMKTGRCSGIREMLRMGVSQLARCMEWRVVGVRHQGALITGMS
jgi:hypothetical protein